MNIGTPPVWESGRVVSTDLDLDVIRFCDGRVEIVDRDEFELHQAEFGYPREVIEMADREAQRVFELVSAKAEPFDGVAAQRWIEFAHASGLASHSPSP